MTSVVVGMSGGMDSSIAAHLLIRAGYRVVGLTMRFAAGDARGDPAVGSARSVCRRLGIPHRVVRADRRFDDWVARDFREEYTAGRTPNPCIVCNERVKFPVLYDYADTHGIDRIATGHYVRPVSYTHLTLPTNREV